MDNDFFIFQTALLGVWKYLIVLALIFIGFGVMLSSSVFGARLKRLGLQIIGSLLFVYVVHAIAVIYFGNDVPELLIYGIYGIVGLLLLQSLVSLLFGPKVSSSLITKLLSTLILFLLGLAFVML
jgi:hypothetical protein